MISKRGWTQLEMGRALGKLNGWESMRIPRSCEVGQILRWEVGARISFKLRRRCWRFERVGVLWMVWVGTWGLVCGFKMVYRVVHLFQKEYIYTVT